MPLDERGSPANTIAPVKPRTFGPWNLRFTSWLGYVAAMTLGQDAGAAGWLCRVPAAVAKECDE